MHCAAEIAGQHGITTPEPSIRVETGDEPSQKICRDRFALDPGIAGMAGKKDGGQCPHLVPLALERETRRALAHMAVNHFGLDRQDVHGPTIAVRLGSAEALG